MAFQSLFFFDYRWKATPHGKLPLEGWLLIAPNDKIVGSTPWTHMDSMGSAGLRSKRFLGFQRADGAKSLVPMGRLRYCIS